MILKSLDDITLADLEQLSTTGVSEGRTLEFKSELPGGKDDDTKEFLADVTSLANTDGGDLIYGVVDEDGVAASAPGVALSASLDATLLRLENLLRDAVQPRLSGVRFLWREKTPDAGLLIVRVPASLAAPHRVTFKGGAKFYHRNSRGKAEMDTHELRLAFTASEALPNRLSKLHQDAVRMVEEGDLPFDLEAGPKAMLSILPLNLLRDERQLDIDGQTAVYPPDIHSISSLQALEGFYVAAAGGDRPSNSFALTRRTGQIDVCWIIGREREGEGLIWPFPMEKRLAATVKGAISKLSRWAIEGPFVVALSLVDVKGYRLVFDPWLGPKPREAWRSCLTLPSIVIESASDEALMPLAKVFWNSMCVTRPENTALGEGG